jgi:hypothetical protein
VALAFQLKLICVEEAIVAVSPVGAAGGATRVVALTTVEGAESPPPLVAITRYRYVVAAVRPESFSDVAVVVPIAAQLLPPSAERSTR